MPVLFQTLLNGLVAGALYSSLGMAFAVIYRGTKVINFAQADIAMVLTFVFFSMIAKGWSWPVAIGAGLVVAVVVGIVVERLVLRPLMGEPLFAVVMATIGLSTMIQGLAGMVWGHDTHRMPDFFPGSLTFAGLSLIKTHLFTLMVSVAMLAVVLLFLRGSRSGLAMRAAASDQDTARLMGIRINRTFAMTWIIAGFLSLGAGLALGFSQFLSTDLGHFILKVFPALILGGMDSVGGVFLGGILVGLFTSLAGSYLGQFMGGGAEEIVAYLLTFMILMVRPYGLFGSKEVERV